MEAQELADGEFPVLRRFLVRGANPITAINANIPRLGDPHPGNPGWLALHYNSEMMGRDAAVVNVTYSRAGAVSPPPTPSPVPIDEPRFSDLTWDERLSVAQSFQRVMRSMAEPGPRVTKSYTLAPRVPWLRVAILSGLASAAVLYAMRLNGWL